MFREYMHVEKFGNVEVDGIELGKVHVFPKLDGTNASAWEVNSYRGYPPCDGEPYISGGSRTREVSIEKDNAGFCSWLLGDQSKHYRDFLRENAQLRLYGEWLVPHTFTGYRPDVWRKFYVFDVYNDETQQYMSYEAYQPLMEKYGIDYIPPLAIIKNGSYENFLKYVNENKYLCPDEGVPGEGVVLKNYDFYNKFGRQVWAKLIRQEFKDQHNAKMGAPDINAGLMNEERILDVALTQHLIDKTHAKIVNDRLGWDSKYIPELLERVYYDIIKEELYDAVKKTKVPSVNFKTLKAMTINRIKAAKPELF